MAGDRVNFNRALTKWDRLRHENKFSDPVEYGDTAIMCSDTAFAETRDEEREQIEAFEQEAFAIHNELRRRKVGSFVLRHVGVAAFQDVLRDTSVSDIVLIGNGSFGSFAFSDSEWRDWQDISDLSDHLKMGKFTQRFCGMFIKGANVPFGTFAMAEHRAIHAPIDQPLPTVLAAEDERAIVPVHNHVRIDYDTIKKLFPYSE